MASVGSTTANGLCLPKLCRLSVTDSTIPTHASWVCFTVLVYWSWMLTVRNSSMS
jgi:hypothetical protein